MTAANASWSVDRRVQALHIGVLLAPWVLGFAMTATTEEASLFGVEGPHCPSRLVTEHGCPGCGLTRSVVLTVHGAFLQGFSVHPAGPAVLVFCLLGVLVRGDILFRGRMTTLQARLLERGHGLFAGAVLAGWFGRILVQAW